jgi:hypothetical protein
LQQRTAKKLIIQNPSFKIPSPMPCKKTPPLSRPGLDSLLGELRGLITQARQQALRVVDLIQVRTCWDVGRHIVEFEQGGKARADYGAGLLAQVAERQIGTLYYERLLTSKDRKAVRDEAQQNLAKEQKERARP